MKAPEPLSSGAFYFLFNRPAIAAALADAGLIVHYLLFTLADQHPEKPQAPGEAYPQQVPQEGPALRLGVGAGLYGHIFTFTFWAIHRQKPPFLLVFYGKSIILL